MTGKNPKGRTPGDGQDNSSLDEELVQLLEEIEREPVPDRLLRLAYELQQALARRKIS